MASHEYTRKDIERLLGAAVGKTLGEVDSKGVFLRAEKNPKITGIAGDVIEQSVLGYPANSDSDPDLDVDGTLVELINALGSAFGLVLGMVGSCALLLLISITSSVSVVIP